MKEREKPDLLRRYLPFNTTTAATHAVVVVSVLVLCTACLTQLTENENENGEVNEKESESGSGSGKGKRGSFLFLIVFSPFLCFSFFCCFDFFRFSVFVFFQLLLFLVFLFSFRFFFIFHFFGAGVCFFSHFLGRLCRTAPSARPPSAGPLLCWRPKISLFFPSPVENVVLSSLTGGLFCGIVVTVQGHAPPRGHVWASLGVFLCRACETCSTLLKEIRAPGDNIKDDGGCRAVLTE